MERYRIVYYNTEGEASEATIDADEGNEAVKQVADMGRLCTIMSMGPVESSDAPLYEGETPDADVNEGDNEPVHERDFPQELPSIEDPIDWAARADGTSRDRAGNLPSVEGDGGEDA